MIHTGVGFGSGTETRCVHYIHSTQSCSPKKLASKEAKFPCVVGRAQCIEASTLCTHRISLQTSSGS